MSLFVTLLGFGSPACFYNHPALHHPRIMLPSLEGEAVTAVAGECAGMGSETHKDSNIPPQKS